LQRVWAEFKGAAKRHFPYQVKKDKQAAPRVIKVRATGSILQQCLFYKIA